MDRVCLIVWWWRHQDADLNFVTSTMKSLSISMGIIPQYIPLTPFDNENWWNSAFEVCPLKRLPNQSLTNIYVLSSGSA